MGIVERVGIGAAARCRGHVVVIDVLRACTTAAFAFAAGAERMFIVSTAEEAFALRRRDSAAMLIGEHQGRPIAGFDCGNSPAALSRRDLSGATVVLRSSNGTQGVIHAVAAEQVLLGCFPIARATVRYLKAAASTTTLLAIGSASGLEGDGAEDIACSHFLAELLVGKQPNAATAVAAVAASAAGQMAHDISVDWISPADVECASLIDCFHFALVVHALDGHHEVRSVAI